MSPPRFLSIMKILENLRQSSRIFGKRRKRFKSVFQMILWVFFNFWKIFGKFRKQFKNFFRLFYNFLKFSENLRKSLEVFGNHRKISDRDRRCSYWFAGVEKFRRSPQKDASKLLRASNDGKEEWNTTRCILQNLQRQS